MRFVHLVAAYLVLVTACGGSTANTAAGAPSDAAIDAGAGSAGDAASAFATAPGASVWVDGIDEVELDYHRDPIGPPLFSMPNACTSSDPRRADATYTFTPATNDFAWSESCALEDDGGGLQSSSGHRPLSQAEAASLVEALRAVVVVGYTPCSSDADKAEIKLSASGASSTYEQIQSGVCSVTLVTGLPRALTAAHALAHD